MLVNVAAVQPLVSDTESTIRSIEKLVRKAAELKCTVLCLPEHCASSNKDGKVFLDSVKKIARKNEVYIITGGEFEEVGSKTYVVSHVIDSSGEEIAVQGKLHLFGIEKNVASNYDKINVFDLNGIRAGIAICHDAVYPEVCRILAIKGCEIIFIPARIKKTGIGPWGIYLMARSLENRVPIVSPNVFSPPLFTGKSTIIDLDYIEDVVIPVAARRAKEGEDLINYSINTEKVRKFREERLNARNVAVYSEILNRYSGLAKP